MRRQVLTLVFMIAFIPLLVCVAFGTTGYGGEEFGVILPNTPGASAVSVMEELRRTIEDIQLKHPGLSDQVVTISIGVSTVMSFDEVLHGGIDYHMDLADQALYRAKQTGRNRVIAAWDRLEDSTAAQV